MVFQNLERVRKSVYILIICVFSLAASAESLDFREIIKQKKAKYLKLKYKVQNDGQRLSEIYRKFIKEDSVVSINHKMVQRTIKKNPKVDLNNLKKGQRFYLYVDVSLLDFDKLSSYRKKRKKTSKKLAKKIKKMKEEAKPKELRGSLFYMASYGKFNQVNPDYADVDFLQNSPVSLGVSASYYPKDSYYSISGSLYFSYLVAAVSEYTNSNISVDPEIGGNVYYEYKMNKPRISIYGGLDFEKFNTFSLESLRDSGEVAFDVNKVGYLTVGISKSVKIFSQNFFTKLSFSQSVYSERTAGVSNPENTETFKGNKVLIYLFKRLKGSFFAHSLFKYHWMSGPSDITTTRLGVGFGYLF